MTDRNRKAQEFHQGAKRAGEAIRHADKVRRKNVIARRLAETFGGTDSKASHRLGRALGMDPAKAYEILNGNIPGEWLHLEVLAEEEGVDLNYLLTGRSAPHLERGETTSGGWDRP